MFNAYASTSTEELRTPIMAQYHALKMQHKDHLLFFRLGDFYELFFEDAKIAAKELDIVLTQRQKNSNHPIPMCGVPAHASDNYIARLIKKGLHVAICEQTEIGVEKGRKSLLKREVVRIITPGTLVEEALLHSKEHNFLLAIYPGSDHILGISWMDISTGDFFIESHSIQRLGSVLSRLCPKEILLPEPLVDQSYIKAIWSEWKSKITTLPLSRFDQPHRRIEEFFNVQTIESFGQFCLHEITAAGALLDYALITQKRETLMLSRPKKIDNEHFLEMDSFTRKNLEIQSTFSGEKKGSLLHTIDHTVTPMGSRLLFMRLTHPIKKIHVIQERLESVEFFVKREVICLHIRELLSLIPDVERALTRLILKRGNPRDMSVIRTTLNTLPSIQKALTNVDGSLPKELSGAIDSLDRHKDLSALLNKALNENLPPCLRDGGVISEGYNEKLDHLHLSKSDVQHTIQDLQKKVTEML